MTRPMGASFKRRSANSSTRAEGASNHGVSSIATTDGPAEASASRTPWKAVEIARWSGGMPVASARRRATSRADRWGGGSPSRLSSMTPSKRSPKAAKESFASDSLGRHESTR
jgi:hypothetical protein